MLMLALTPDNILSQSESRCVDGGTDEASDRSCDEVVHQPCLVRLQEKVVLWVLVFCLRMI